MAEAPNDCHMPKVTVKIRAWHGRHSLKLHSPRLCCKNHLGYKNTERYFSSGDNLEEIGHESNLSANVAFPDSFNLSLPDHVVG